MPRSLTLRARMWSDQPCVNPTAQKLSSSALVQMFEPIRDDLRDVEREFARHVQSHVAMIPTIGNYVKESGGKRINHARVEDIQQSGATTAAVGCPFCVQMFDDALGAKDPEGTIKARDIAELVAESLEE